MSLFDFFKKKPTPQVAEQDSVVTPPTSEPTAKKKPADKSKGQKHRLAGVKYYEKNIMELAVENPDYTLKKNEIIKAGRAEETIWKYNFPEEPVTLEFEPENEHDPNAIKVLLSGLHIGYIKAGSCVRVRNLILNDKIDRIVCNIGGGPYKCVEDQNYDVEGKPDYHMEQDTSSFSASIRIFEKL